jgi:hypothetical protein
MYVWKVLYMPEAEVERAALDARERQAVYNAVRKLEAEGLSLGYPHSSAVVGAENLRELRPRGGRSAWRALYRRVGEVFVIAAVGPEAQSDKRGFDRACEAALKRLGELEEG